MNNKEYNIPSHLEKIIEFKTTGMTPPNRIVFGFNAAQNLPEEAMRFGEGPYMLVSDEIMKEIGVVDQIKAYLENVGLKVECFTSVEPEPHIETIENLCNLCIDMSSKVIIGIGGGSVMDVSKLVAEAVGSRRPSREYAEGHINPEGNGLPLILLPTTAGTGSEVSPYTVVKIGDKKRFLLDQHYYPNMALIDPLLTLTMPPSVTASTGIDALSHAIEGMMVRNANVFTETFALSGIGMISKYMRRAVADGHDLEARYYMSMAATLCMMAMSTSGGSYSHSASFVISQFKPTAHGVGCGLGMPYLMEFNRPVIREKLVKIAAAMGEPTWKYSEEHSARQAVLSVINLMKDCNLPISLKEYGNIDEDCIEEMAEIMIDNYPRALNPRVMTKADAVQYFEKMWHGRY
jgi:alcohol dehydrogenase class IV